MEEYMTFLSFLSGMYRNLEFSVDRLAFIHAQTSQMRKTTGPHSLFYTHINGFIWICWLKHPQLISASERIQ